MFRCALFMDIIIPLQPNFVKTRFFLRKYLLRVLDCGFEGPARSGFIEPQYSITGMWARPCGVAHEIYKDGD
jgi:hypothetical protein